MSKTLRVALVQDRDRGSRDANLDAIEAAVGKAAADGAKLVLLQELHNGPYFCQHESVDEFDLAEPIPGPSTERLSALAKLHRVVLVASLFERRAAGLYHNTAVVFEADGRVLGKYRKMHIPDDPGFMEKFYFTPGDIGFHPIATSVGKLGVLVCWDQWYPEAARLMALAGAELLLYPTAIGWDPADVVDEKERQRDAWITVQRGHAVANGLPLLACNRTGFEPAPEHADGKRTEANPTAGAFGNAAGSANGTAGTGVGVDTPTRVADTHMKGIQFWGTSFVAGPQGEFLAKASTDACEVLLADIDLKRSEAVRRIWPFLRDRRIDAYEDLLKRFRD